MTLDVKMAGIRHLGFQAVSVSLWDQLHYRRTVWNSDIFSTYWPFSLSAQCSVDYNLVLIALPSTGTEMLTCAVLHNNKCTTNHKNSQFIVCYVTGLRRTSKTSLWHLGLLPMSAEQTFFHVGWKGTQHHILWKRENMKYATRHFWPHGSDIFPELVHIWILCLFRKLSKVLADLHQETVQWQSSPHRANH